MLSKRYYIVVLAWLIPFFSSAQAPSQEVVYLQKFVSEMALDSLPTDVLLSQYVIVSKGKDEDYLNYLLASLDEVRLNIRSKSVDKIEYLNWHQLPKKETRDIDPENLDSKNMYFLQYKGRQVVAIYLENGKIASFTLVSKGNKKAHFVTY